MEQFIAN